MSKPTKFYTPAATLSKFAKMWNYINILLDHKNSEDAKLFALAKMEVKFDDETREHFRMGLAQSLREENNPIIRKQALSLLAAYFEWHEIEWTFWLHGKRCKDDWELLDTYEVYCQTKRYNKDDETLHQVIIQQANEKLGITV